MVQFDIVPNRPRNKYSTNHVNWIIISWNNLRYKSTKLSCLNWFSDNDYRVYTLSKLYLTITGIIITSFKSQDNFNFPKLMRKAIRYLWKVIKKTYYTVKILKEWHIFTLTNFDTFKIISSVLLWLLIKLYWAISLNYVFLICILNWLVFLQLQLRKSLSNFQIYCDRVMERRLYSI